MSKGAELIAIERKRQVAEEDFTFYDEDRWSEGTLSAGAICYIEASFHTSVTSHWPWGKSYFKPKDKLSNLIRAGAFVAAEIDKLLRAEAKNKIDDC